MHSGAAGDADDGPVQRRSDQPGDLFLAEYGRQALVLLGKRERIGQVRTAQSLDEQKPQPRRLSCNRSSRKLAVAEQMDLVLAHMIGAKLFGRPVKVSGKLLHRMQVRPHGVRRVVTTLDISVNHIPCSNCVALQDVHCSEAEAEIGSLAAQGGACTDRTQH